MRSGRTNRNKEEKEREIADFLSSIDDDLMRSSKRGLGQNVSNISGGDLFFDPIPSSGNFNMVSSATGSNEDGSLGVEYRGELEEGTTPAWLQDFQALKARDPLKSQAATGMTGIDSDNYGEVLGAEPEILDEGFAPVHDKLRIDGESRLSGEKHAGDYYRSETGASRAWTAGANPNTAARITDHALPGGTDEGSSAFMSEENSDKQRLDWPRAMDMLGLAVSDGQKQSQKQQPSRAVAGLPVTGLPTMPPPSPREGSFPDFVELRDARSVSQWPKPSGSVSSGGGGAGETASEGTTAIGAQSAAGRGTRLQSALPAPLRTVEMYLRPDVTWESVSDVYMAVMLSRGLVVREETDKMVTAEKAADSSGDWATVTLRVGVTRDKLRTLVMQFYADTRAPILSLAGTMGRFSGKAGDELYSAIRDALVERRMPLSFLNTEARQVSLDPHYVRDLVAMYAHENVVNLTRYALPLEEFVREEEKRTARLEATLIPKYRAYGIAPPRPTRSKQLSAYPLTTCRPPVASCGVEEASAIIERAREHAGNVFENVGGASGMPGGGQREDPGAVAQGIRALLRATWEDVKEWCDEEAEARVRRKDSQVRDRLVAVERHREALVSVLRDGAGGSTAQSTPTGREFAARFRPMSSEAVLCDCKAVHDRRVGQLYLTFNHLCFHSSMLGFTHQKVLPLVTVGSVSRPAVAMPVAVDTVTVVDLGGESYSFGISTVEAGFPERFHDLLQQVLVMCKADAARRVAKEASTVDEDGGALDGEPDEMQILARVQRLAKAKQLREAKEEASAAVAAPAPSSNRPFDNADVSPAPSTSHRTGQGAISPPQDDILSLDEEVGGRLVIGQASENADERSDSGRGAATSAPATEKRAGGGGSGGGARGASMMAMSIQAFLEESQRKS